MQMTYEQIKEMNSIQLDILKNFIKVCSSLGIEYFMIHGSLLGAVRYKSFFPFDDDIDIAMYRQDYNKFIEEGSKIFPSHLFIQSCETEQSFPLNFAKIRNSNTTFIQPIMKNLNINQGIYIDIFPIDNFPQNKIKRKWLLFLETIYKVRISKKLEYETKQPFYKNFIRNISSLLCPSWEKAVKKRAELYSRVNDSDEVIVVGGKKSERGIPNKWFQKIKKITFENIEVNCPGEYEKYLSCIYGDYKNYDPAKKYMNSNGTVTVSAAIFSSKKTYKNFII